MKSSSAKLPLQAKAKGGLGPSAEVWAPTALAASIAACEASVESFSSCWRDVLLKFCQVPGPQVESYNDVKNRRLQGP